MHLSLDAMNVVSSPLAVLPGLPPTYFPVDSKGLGNKKFRGGPVADGDFNRKPHRMLPTGDACCSIKVNVTLIYHFTGETSV